jgi:hypothetical protein
MFNDREGLTTMLNQEDMSKDLEIVEDDSGHDMIIRTVENQSESSLFTELEGGQNLSKLEHLAN